MNILNGVSKLYYSITNPLHEPRRSAQEYAAAHPEALPEKIETAAQLCTRYSELLIKEVTSWPFWGKKGLDVEWMRSIFKTFAETQGDVRCEWWNTPPSIWLRC